MMVFAVSGEPRITRLGRRIAVGLAREHGGLHAGRAFGERWARSRYRAPYLRDRLWEIGYGVDSVETAASWSLVPQLLTALEEALRSALHPWAEPVHAFTHLSHVYPQGSSVYTTFLFRLSPDPDVTLERWRALKSAASRAILAGGGTISHQHGVGADHREWMEREKGSLGVRAIRGVLESFDPDGMFNPGKLL